MLSMDVVFTQILVILLYILVGWVAGRCGLINAEQRKYLTTVCTSLILPFTVLSASSQAITRQALADLGLCFLMILGICAATTSIALWVQRALHFPKPATVTTAALLTFPNCTFLGLPLGRALFGDVAILYNVPILLAVNVLFFSWHSSMFTGERFRPKNLVTPGMIATFLLLMMLTLGIRFPSPVQTVVSNTGAMMTPLSLIIIGVMMSESQIALLLKERRAYVITLFRNLLIPLAAMPLIGLLPGDGAFHLCELIFLACPCATLTAIYAIKCDMEPELAARSVLMSTLLFAVTLPVISLIGMRFYS